jgi:hypothetical protein
MAEDMTEDITRFRQKAYDLHVRQFDALAHRCADAFLEFRVTGGLNWPLVSELGIRWVVHGFCDYFPQKVHYLHRGVTAEERTEAVRKAFTTARMMDKFAGKLQRELLVGRPGYIVDYLLHTVVRAYRLNPDVLFEEMKSVTRFFIPLIRGVMRESFDTFSPQDWESVSSSRKVATLKSAEDKFNFWRGFYVKKRDKLLTLGNNCAFLFFDSIVSAYSAPDGM